MVPHQITFKNMKLNVFSFLSFSWRGSGMCWHYIELLTKHCNSMGRGVKTDTYIYMSKKRLQKKENHKDKAGVKATGSWVRAICLIHLWNKCSRISKLWCLKLLELFSPRLWPVVLASALRWIHLFRISCDSLCAQGNVSMSVSVCLIEQLLSDQD